MNPSDPSPETPTTPPTTPEPKAASSEILITPDGRILAHHLTPELAEVLHVLSTPIQPLPAVPHAEGPTLPAATAS